MIYIHRWHKFVAALIFFVWSLLSAAQFAVCQQLQPESGSDDVEVLTRGPLHEAFAAPIGEEPSPSQEVPRQPPEPINEIPPEVKPEGDDVIWINGYWHWEEERSDFIWVSGVWRRTPASQRWVPGYWDEVDGRYRWISGFWVGADVEELSYQPYPPASLETGPSSLAPTDEHVWVPGCWVYQSDNYAWRPGYWWEPVVDSVYIPSHYTWTPNGCIYVAGYYDLPLQRRGVLFSPVYFRRPAYAQVGFRYSPYVTIDTTGLLLHLFFRPSVGHYCFGDYYGIRNRSYYPWFDYQRGGRHYDPFHAYFKATHRHTGVDYSSRARGWHNYFATHSDRRPPHTLGAQHRYETQHRNDSHLHQSLLGKNVKDLRGREHSGNRFVQINDEARGEFARRAQGARDISSQRFQVESRSHSRLPVSSHTKKLSLPIDAGRQRGIVRTTTDRPSNSPGRTSKLSRPDRGSVPHSQRTTSRHDLDPSVLNGGRNEDSQPASDIRSRSEALRRSALGDRQPGNSTRPSPSVVPPSGNVLRNPSLNSNRTPSPANAPVRRTTPEGRENASASAFRSSPRSNRSQSKPTRLVPQASPGPSGQSNSNTTPRSLPSIFERALNSTERPSSNLNRPSNRATSPGSTPRASSPPFRSPQITPSQRSTRSQPAFRSTQSGPPARHSPSIDRSRPSPSTRAVPTTRPPSFSRSNVSSPSRSRSAPSRSLSPPSRSSPSTPSFRSTPSRSNPSQSQGRGGSRSRRDRG